MGKKLNIIHINGKRYDTHTGAPLDREHAASSTAVVKPIPVKHTPSKPVATTVKTAHHKPGHRKATRSAIKSVKHHKQQRSTTLMRQAVHKPGVSLKRHVKVQSHTGTLAEKPAVAIAPKISFGAANPKRLAQASRIKKSDLIMHFNPHQPDYSVQRITVSIGQTKPAAVAKPKPVPRQQAPDIDDIFERAIQHANSHLEPAPQKTKKRRFHLARKHARA